MTTVKTTPPATVIPSALADLEWIWVLAGPWTKVSDSLFALEIETEEGDRRLLPIFETREDAEALKGRLCRERAGEHGAQAMLLSEAGRFAAEHRLEMALLEADGTIAARFQAYRRTNGELS